MVRIFAIVLLAASFATSTSVSAADSTGAEYVGSNGMLAVYYTLLIVLAVSLFLLAIALIGSSIKRFQLSRVIAKERKALHEAEGKLAALTESFAKAESGFAGCVGATATALTEARIELAKAWVLLGAAYCMLESFRFGKPPEFESDLWPRWWMNFSRRLYPFSRHFLLTPYDAALWRLRSLSTDRPALDACWDQLSRLSRERRVEFAMLLAAVNFRIHPDCLERACFCSDDYQRTMLGRLQSLEFSGGRARAKARAIAESMYTLWESGQAELSAFDEGVGRITDVMAFHLSRLTLTAAYDVSWIDLDPIGALAELEAIDVQRLCLKEALGIVRAFEAQLRESKQIGSLLAAADLRLPAIAAALDALRCSVLDEVECDPASWIARYLKAKFTLFHAVREEVDEFVRLLADVQRFLDHDLPDAQSRVQRWASLCACEGAVVEAADKQEPVRAVIRHRGALFAALSAFEGGDIAFARQILALIPPPPEPAVIQAA